MLLGIDTGFPSGSVSPCGRINSSAKELREQYPRWGKEKLCILLRESGIEVSAD